MSALLSFLVGILSMVVPPVDGSNPVAVARHHAMLTFMTIGVIMGLSVHIALACGFLPSIFSGFAKADDVTIVRQTVVNVQVTLLDEQIYTLREKQCKTPDAYKGEVTQRLYALLDQYRQAAGHAYRLPDCNEF